MTPSGSIAHYRLSAKLGEGGMGAVYRATDTKLNRDVAIKVLPTAFAGDADRMARFEREAQVLASLNHPHIAAIYGVESGAIVMEMVEGEDLKGPVPLDAAISYAKQIALALEAAHEKGIVHRDLKPANIKVTPDGTVKLLDFGLAKAAESSTASNANSPTLTLGATQAGVILGTAAYMAPEQATGKPVDKRADIWAFGVVLYELLTGKPLFTGETVSHILASVLKDPIDLGSIPGALRPLLARCLERDPRQRLRDIGEARVFLSTPIPEAAVAVAPARSSAMPWTAAFGFALSTAVLAFLYFRAPTAERPLLRFSLLPPPKTAFNQFSLSPDGRHLAFTTEADGNYDLWVRDLDAAAARKLANIGVFGSPFWSPDSRNIAYFDRGKLRKTDLAGGQPVAICDAQNPRGGTWGSRGVIVFAPTSSGTLMRVPAAGGNPVPASRADAPRESTHRWPFFLPDGQHFVFLTRGGSRDATALWMGDIASLERRRVAPGASSPAYDPRGFLLFFQQGALRAMPFDAGRGQTSGDAVPVSEEVEFQLNNSLAKFSVSQSGMMAWMAGLSTGNEQLTWYDRSGAALGTVGPTGQMANAAISPDGRYAASDRLSVQNSTQDIWLYDLVRGTESRFTFSGFRDQQPTWSPDGRYIAWASSRDGKFGIYAKPAAGDAPEQALYESAQPLFITDWSRDGRLLVLYQQNGENRPDILILSDPLDPAKHRVEPWLATPAAELDGVLSPDGKWIAYTSTESGSYQIYLSSFPEKRAKYQISRDGGSHPLWSRDGKELFFLNPNRALHVVQVRTGAGLLASDPKLLFNTRVTTSAMPAISPDGKRFLMPAILNTPGDTPIHIVTDWRATLNLNSAAR